MIGVLKADLFKAARSKAFPVLFCVSCTSAVIMAVSSHMAATGELSIEAAYNFPALFVDSQMISLLGCATVGLVVCTDFENKAIHSSVAGGIGRLSIVAAKTILVAVLTTVLLLPYVVVTIYALISDYSFSPYIQTPLLSILSFDVGDYDAPRLAWAMVATVVLYASQLCICVVAMFVTKKPVITLAVSYVVLLLLALASNINDSFKELMGLTPFGVERLETLTPSISFEALIVNIIVAFGFIAFAVMLSYVFFRRAELR